METAYQFRRHHVFTGTSSPVRFTCELPSSGEHPARTITVNVGFGLHVFTCALANAGRNAEPYGDDRELRAFDYDRYSASLHIGSLLRALESRKCYFAKNRNFFTADATHAPVGQEYRVFFSVARDRTSAEAVNLIAQSAYFGSTDWGQGDWRRKPVGFRVILLNTILGKTLREPP